MEYGNLLDLPSVLTVDELAGFLRIGRNSAYQLIRDHEIDCIRAGRNIRIPQKALLQFLETHDER